MRRLAALALLFAIGLFAQQPPPGGTNPPNQVNPTNQIKWPMPDCQTGVYSPAGNTCVAPGTAANPAGGNMDVQINANGQFGAAHGTFTYNPTTNMLYVPALSPTIQGIMDWTDKTKQCVNYRGQLNVTDCGAVGDGVTDDTAAIQLAHTAICARGGGTIFYPTTAYTTPSGTRYGINPSVAQVPINTCSNLTEEMAGGVWLYVLPASGDFEAILGPVANSGVTQDNITFRHFNVDENIQNNLRSHPGLPGLEKATPGIPCANPPVGRPYYCYQWIFLFAGHLNGYVTNLTIEDSKFITGGVNVLAATDGNANTVPSTITTNISFIHNKVTFAKQPATPEFDNSGVYIDAFTGTIVKDCLFTTANQSITDAATTGIEIHGGPSTIAHNEVDWYRLGGYLANSLSSTWDNNIIRNAAFGIQLFQQYAMDGNILIGNKIYIDNVDRYSQIANSGGIAAGNNNTVTAPITNTQIVRNTVIFQQDTNSAHSPNPYNSGGIGLFSYGAVTNALIEGNIVVNSPVTCINIGSGGSTTGVTTSVIAVNNLLTDCGTLSSTHAFSAAIWLQGTLRNVQAHDNPITFTSSPFIGNYAIVGNPLTATGGFVANNPVSAVAGTPTVNLHASMSQVLPITLGNAITGYMLNGTAGAVGNVLRSNGTIYGDSAIQFSDLPPAVRGGSVTYTATQTAQASDNGLYVLLNCVSCSYILPTGLPNGWHIFLATVTTSNTITLGTGAIWWGQTPPSVPLNAFRWYPIYDNNGNFQGEAPILAGSGIILTPSSTGMTIASSYAGTTGSISGTIAAGACDTGTANITGVTTAMDAHATPQTYPGDVFRWQAYVSAPGVVTVKLCSSPGGTPTASAYNVRVFP